MRKRLFWWEAAGFLWTCGVGTLLHFVYEWSGENVLVAAFSAVNESTWEHMKLLFFAILLVGFLIGQVAFTPIIFMPFVMILFGYALSIVCLYGSSQYVSRVLFKELPYRQGKLPKIQLQK